MQTNLLLEIVRLSLVVIWSGFLAADGYLKSPIKFSLSQLMTCLVLQAYLKKTYRGVVDFLVASSQELCDAIGQKKLPYNSTLKRFGDRSNVAEIAETMITGIIRECAP